METFTQTPNFVFDLMAKLSPAEFKVLMVIVRKTHGYREEWAKISFSLFTEMTGLTRQGAFNCVESLAAAGHIERRQIGNSFEYKTNRSTELNDLSEEKQSTELNETVNSVERHDDQESEIVQLSRTESFNSVDPLNKKENYQQAAAANASLNGHGAPGKAFVSEYERIWGLLIASDYEREKVEYWADHIPIEAWTYGLRESADSRKVGNWKYFESILKRVEREGLQSTPVAPTGKVEFSVAGML